MRTYASHEEALNLIGNVMCATTLTAEVQAVRELYEAITGNECPRSVPVDLGIVDAPAAPASDRDEERKDK